MTITLIVITAALAASAGYFASRRRGPKGEIAEANDSPAKKNVKAAPPAPKPLDGFGLELGDVISSGGEERWLSGAVLAREQTVVTALFFAPEGREHWVVAAFPLPERDIFWLRPVEVVPPAEPPATLEIEGLTMQRKSRLPVRFERIGQGAPNVGSSGMLAIYTAGAREVAIVLTSGDQCLGWSGRRVDSGEYDRMGQSLDDE
jgi:hypothetical protein